MFLLPLLLSLGLADAAITPANFQLALDALPGLGQRAVNSSGVPGLAIAVVYNGAVRYTGSFGVRKVGESDPITSETVFQIASLSKPISSTIVSAIISRSNLTWTSPTNSPSELADYSDPWISSQLTITDGFTHRSGLGGVVGDDLELFGLNRTTIFSRMKYISQFAPFRASWTYSNYGMTLAAAAAARITGMDWEDAAQMYLYGPLGMTSTSSRYSDFLTRSNRASLHVPSGGIYAGGNWTAAPPRNPDPQSPSGGVTSNLNDMAKWLQLHLNLGRNPATGEVLVRQDALNQTRQPLIVRGSNPITGLPGFYGLGWNVDNQEGTYYVSHAGAFSQGARSLAKLSVEDGLGIVIIANCFPTGWPEGLADTFFDIAQYGRTRQDYIATWNGIYSRLVQSAGSVSPYATSPPGGASAAQAASSYSGLYYNNYVGLVRVDAGSNSSDLVLTMPGTSNASFTLKHYSRDSFFIADSPNDPYAGVTFAVGASGNASSITIDRINYNAGTLKRFTPTS